jgi:hypothetical protein
MFDPLLRQNGIQWDAIPDASQKRELALQILAQVPVLWLWDNVEPVAGFPAGTPSAWTAAEQAELLAFLRDARGTQTRFLLTSRRDERGWLGDLPARVEMLPMPMHERQQLAEALAAKCGVAFDQATWRPPLVYSGGNPLTLTVVVGQALRDGLRTGQQIRDYVQQLRAGEAAFDDDASQGRTRSLGASLSYGFGAAFTEQDRRTLALLHHFQGFVDVDVLTWMGDTSKDWHVPAVVGLTREQAIALLERAAEVGLLAAYVGGYYRIHPALPWFFRQLYQEHYPDDAPTRAYVEAMGDLGNYYHNQYGAGNRGVIAALKAEEANLMYAWRLAQQHGWFWRIIDTMQGLGVLYDHTGRRAEWRRLVEEIVPLFVDPATDGLLPGREEEWWLVNDYRVRLLREERQWAAAARLQALQVDHQRQQAAPLLILPSEQLDASQRNTLRSLAVSLHELGQIQREQGDAACVDSYQESYELALRIGDQPLAAICAFNLGRFYTETPVSRDLAQAQQWYHHALDGWPEGDQLNRGKTLGQLGLVARERFKEARQTGQPGDMLAEYWNAALHAYQQALNMLPPDEVDTRAMFHNQLGNIYGDASQIDQAIAHHREAIRYFEQAGSLYYAAATRHNVAIYLTVESRLEEALLFARAALCNFERFGPSAAQEVERIQKLVTQIEISSREGSILVSELPNQLITRVIRFDKRIDELLRKGRIVQVIHLCECESQSSTGVADDMISIARIRLVQVLSLTDSDDKMRTAIDRALAPGQSQHLAAIAFAVCLFQSFHSGNVEKLQNLIDRFSEDYGLEALRRGFNLCSYMLTPILQMPQEKLERQNATPNIKNEEENPQSLYLNKSDIEWVKAIVMGSDAMRAQKYEEAIRLYEIAEGYLHCRQARHTLRIEEDTFSEDVVPWLAVRFLLGKAHFLNAAYEQAKIILEDVKKVAKGKCLYVLGDKATLTLTEIPSEHVSDGTIKTFIENISSSETDSFTRLRVISKLCTQASVAPPLRGYLKRALKDTAQNHEKIFQETLDFCRRLEQSPPQHDLREEFATYALLFPSLFPGARDSQERHAGSILFDQLAHRISLSELQLDTLRSLLCLTSIYQKLRHYSRAAETWQRYMAIEQSYHGSLDKFQEERDTQIEAARLYRLCDEYTKAVQNLESAKKRLTITQNFKSEQGKQAEKARLIRMQLEARLYKEWANVEMDCENFREALRLCREGLRRAKQTSDIILTSQILYIKGCIQARMDIAEWKSTFKEVMQLAQSQNDPILDRLSNMTHKILTSFASREADDVSN